MVLPVAGLPHASTMRTTGWIVQVEPPVPPLGETVNWSAAAGPAVTPKPPLVAPARPGADAASAYPVPTRSTVQPP